MKLLQRLPSPNAQIDWSNPLTKGLQVAFHAGACWANAYGGSGVAILNGRRRAQWLRGLSYGGVYEGDGTNGLAYLGDFKTSLECTVVVDVQIDGAGGGSYSRLFDNGQGNVAINGSGQLDVIRACASGSAVAAVDASIGWDANFNVWGFYFPNSILAANLKGYKNGNQVSLVVVSNGALATTNNNTIASHYLFGNSGNARNVDGRSRFYYQWNRQLSAAEHLQLAKDPFCIWKEPEVPVYDPSRPLSGESIASSSGLADALISLTGSSNALSQGQASVSTNHVLSSAANVVSAGDIGPKALASNSGVARSASLANSTKVANCSATGAALSASLGTVVNKAAVGGRSDVRTTGKGEARTKVGLRGSDLVSSIGVTDANRRVAVGAVSNVQTAAIAAAGRHTLISGTNTASSLAPTAETVTPGFKGSGRTQASGIAVVALSIPIKGSSSVLTSGRVGTMTVRSLSSAAATISAGTANARMSTLFAGYANLQTSGIVAARTKLSFSGVGASVTQGRADWNPIHLFRGSGIAFGVGTAESVRKRAISGVSVVRSAASATVRAARGVAGSANAQSSGLASGLRQGHLSGSGSAQSQASSIAPTNQVVLSGAGFVRSDGTIPLPNLGLEATIMELWVSFGPTQQCEIGAFDEIYGSLAAIDLTECPWSSPD